MNPEPSTLGDWYELLKPSDYAEAAKLTNQNREPPPWASTFLRNWAPELINGRKRWEKAQNRKFVLDQLAIIESSAQRVVEAMESDVIKFLQLPPFASFESELGAKMFVSSLVARARNAMESPNLSTAEDEGRRGAGKARPPTQPNPKELCAAIIAELWYSFHGSYPKAARNALRAATSYWCASGGTLNSWSGQPERSWIPYFKRIDNPLLWGSREELQRQLNL